MRTLKLACLLLLTLWLGGCASLGPKMDALEQMQYDYSAAIRWGDFEGAWQAVDPDYRKKHPLTDLQFERFKQIQVSGYTDLAAQSNEQKAIREISIGIINRHNMTERSIRYTEMWEYDEEAKRWWVVNGLPDFWEGQ